jgi:hypothetical protein
VGILRIDDRQVEERTTAKCRIPFMAEWCIHSLGFATAKCYVQFVFRQEDLGF